MKVFRFIFLLTNGILLATNSRAQTPVEIIDFLKKNLIIKYLGDPNTKDPKIETIDPEKIIQNTKGIVFGTKNNNKMDVNAQMVTSIYKDRASGKGGDGLFQDALYQILHLINKPAEIVFINDAMKALDPQYMSQYRFDTMRGTSGRLLVYPGTFSPPDPAFFGTVMMGQQGFDEISLIKGVFLMMMNNLCLGETLPMNWFMTWTGPGENPGAANPADRNTISYSLPTNDTRRTVNAGISNALLYSMNPTNRNGAYGWANNPHITVYAVRPPDADSSAVWPVIPENMTLRNELNKDNLLRFGTAPLPGYAEEDKHRASMKVFPLNDLPLKYKIRNEIFIGILVDQFIRKKGIPGFESCLSLQNSRYIKSSPANKLTLLIENLCLGMLKSGRTLADVKANPPSAKDYLFGLALFDMVVNFPSDANAAAFNQLTGGTIDAELLNLYFTQARNDIRTAAMSVTVTATGNKYDAITDAIAKILQMN